MDETDEPNESYIVHSRISPIGNGKKKIITQDPSNQQKWWVSILLGLIFFLFANPVVYYIMSWCSKSIGGMDLYTPSSGPKLVCIIILTLLYIVFIRFILW